ncbi:MAG: DUF938 domain-containing protein [Polyangiales bacterium]
MKVCWPWPERNKGPILEVLREVLPARGVLLEIASGSGQHAAHFAAHLPGLTIQPSDFDPALVESIRAYQQEAGPNLRPPVRLDVEESDWGVGTVDAIFCANLIHIAPWSCCEGLLAGAGRHLAQPGVLVLYGPYRIDGAHTAESNAAFDASLRGRDPRWGVRDLEEVVRTAEGAGLTLHKRVAMPANNQCVVFARPPAA